MLRTLIAWVPRRMAAPAVHRAMSTEASPTTHYRITLRRSAIGLPKRTGRIVEALGLRKRLQSVYHMQSPTIAGMVLAIKELVHVENVRQLELPAVADQAQTEPIWVNENGEVVDAGRLARKAPKGFKVVGNLVNEERDAALRAGRVP
ncbi:hypothetical protein MCAP1_003504 [Malassezia caprae]|uniref:Large ribosomal subunit protein uL30m n=1 Tax=Malassezia caprae TaxID=1381934 RepID=A0AAF0EBD4_9BASI|nr:hypothetical protein MCAP1_003504 [Malassezia caprae]